jgi:hypothetical protein
MNDSYAIREVSRDFRDAVRVWIQPNIPYTLRSVGYVDWARGHNGFRLTSEYMTIACYNEDFGTMDYLRDLGCPFDVIIWREDFSLRVLRWLCIHNPDKLKPHDARIIVRRGDLNTVKFIMGMFQRDSKFGDQVILSGNIDAVKWFFRDGNEYFSYGCIIHAIACRKLDVTKFVYDRVSRDLSVRYFGASDWSGCARVIGTVEIYQWALDMEGRR